MRHANALGGFSFHRSWKHTIYCASELVFFCVFSFVSRIAWSRTVWVTVIFIVLLFYFFQFLPYFNLSFLSRYCSFSTTCHKCKIKKWLLNRGIGVSTAVLGRSHIAVGIATLMNVVSLGIVMLANDFVCDPVHNLQKRLFHLLT